MSKDELCEECISKCVCSDGKKRLSRHNGREGLRDVADEVFVLFSSEREEFNRMVVVRIVFTITHMMTFEHSTAMYETVYNKPNEELVRFGKVKAKSEITHSFTVSHLVLRGVNEFTNMTNDESTATYTVERTWWRWRWLLTRDGFFQNAPSEDSNPAVGHEKPRAPLTFYTCCPDEGSCRRVDGATSCSLLS